MSRRIVDLIIAVLMLVSPVLVALSIAGVMRPGFVDACMVAWVCMCWLDAEFKGDGKGEPPSVHWRWRLLRLWAVLACVATIAHTCAHNLPLGLLACMSVIWLMRLESTSSCLQQADDANRRIVMRVLNTRDFYGLQVYQDELAAVAAEAGVHVTLQRALRDHGAVERALEQVKEKMGGGR